MFACAPLCGCTLTCSQSNSRFARSIASCSTVSTFSQPPYQRLFGKPSAYLLVRTVPCASITARLVKFSDAISSMFSRCRFSSAVIASKTCGSTLRRPPLGGFRMDGAEYGLSLIGYAEAPPLQAEDGTVTSLSSTNASTLGKAFLIVCAQVM